MCCSCRWRAASAARVTEASVSRPPVPWSPSNECSAFITPTALDHHATVLAITLLPCRNACDKTRGAVKLPSSALQECSTLYCGRGPNHAGGTGNISRVEEHRRFVLGSRERPQLLELGARRGRPRLMLYRRPRLMLYRRLLPALPAARQQLMRQCSLAISRARALSQLSWKTQLLVRARCGHTASSSLSVTSPPHISDMDMYVQVRGENLVARGIACRFVYVL